MDEKTKHFIDGLYKEELEHYLEGYASDEAKAYARGRLATAQSAPGLSAQDVRNIVKSYWSEKLQRYVTIPD